MSQAVAHMDEMTQQNAALAEQSAASAASLSSQIERLNDLVATFRTRGSAKSPPRAAVFASRPERASVAAAEMTPARSRPRRAAAGGGRDTSWEEF